MTRGDTLALFATCAPGLEALAARQLGGLGADPILAVDGGVEFAGNLETLYRANLESGVVSHVRVRIAKFDARHFSVLAREAARVDWQRWVDPGRPVEVRATSKRSKLYHSKAIEERLLEAVNDRLGGLPRAQQKPPTRVHARFHRDRCELSIDTSGEALHRRGWRLQTAKAPLREDLAHALLMVTGWQRSMTLLDPMMGSGTIAIEAARMAMGIAPGWGRAFAFESMPNFDHAAWQRVKSAAQLRQGPAPQAIVGRDRERGALEAARGNAERAGVREALRLERASLDESDFGGVQAVITNPPYGRRVGRGSVSQVRSTWCTLGTKIQAAKSVTTVGLVSPDRALAKLTSLPLQPRLLTDHGGIKVEFMTFASPAPDRRG